MSQLPPAKASAWDSVFLDLAALGAAFVIWLLPVSGQLAGSSPLRGADADAIYAALVGLQGALLGFVLAALAIIAGYSQSDRMQILRDARQLPNLFGVYLAATRSYALSTFVSLLALLISATPGIFNLVAIIVGATVLTSALRLLRVLRVTRVVLLALS